MDLDKYRVLLEVLKSGSITSASEVCGYTASGISRMINTMEKEQGFPLLYRNHDGIRPTQELELLLPYIREMLFQENLMRGKADEIKGLQKGEIRIGIAYSSYYSWIAEKTTAFSAAHEGVRFRFVNGYSSELLNELKNHELDFCLISEREGTELWVPLGREELAAWLPVTHPLAQAGSVPLQIFEKENYIDIYPGKDIDNRRIFEKYGIHPNTVMSAEDSYAVYSMVEAGLGISLNHTSNSSAWNGKVAVVKLDPYLAVTVGIAAERRQSPLTAAFWDFLT